MNKWKELLLMAGCVLLAFGMIAVIVWMTCEMYGCGHDASVVAEMVNRGVV